MFYSIADEPDVRVTDMRFVLPVARMKNILFPSDKLLGKKKLPADTVGIWIKNILVVGSINLGSVTPNLGRVRIL